MILGYQWALLEIMKASLFGASPNIPADVDWDALFKEAELHAVTGLAVHATPRTMNINWDLVEMKCKALFLRVMQGQKQLIQVLNEANIVVVVLKGMAAAKYYPLPFLRMMGDVDVLVEQEQFECAARQMASHGYKSFHDIEEQLQASGPPRHIEFIKDGVEYELHHHFSTGVYDIEKYLIEGIKHAEVATICDVEFPVLPTLENGLLILTHAAIHLNAAELGLRQVIDWMMFVFNVLDEDIWKYEFSQMADSVGLKKLAEVLTRLCRDYLGLPGEYNWCNEADEGVTENLLEFILERGNFGRKHEGPQTVVKYSVGLENQGFFCFLKSISRVVWNSTRVKNSFILLRPYVYLGEFVSRVWKRLSERPANIFEDINRGRKISKLYKELGLN